MIDFEKVRQEEENKKQELEDNMQKQLRTVDNLLHHREDEVIFDSKTQKFVREWQKNTIA